MIQLTRTILVLAIVGGAAGTATAEPAVAEPAAAQPAAAQPAAAQPTLRMSVEIDPADYAVYDGWGVFVGVRPAAHRYFGSGRGGFFLGGVAGWSSLTFTAPAGGSVDVANLFAGIDLGYRWFPSTRLGLVVTPHLGAIVPIWKSSEPTVGSQTYDLLPVIPLPQLLIGYELDVLK